MFISWLQVTRAMALNEILYMQFSCINQKVHPRILFVCANDNVNFMRGILILSYVTYDSQLAVITNARKQDSSTNYTM